MDIFDRVKIEKYMFDELNRSHPIFQAMEQNELIIFVGAGMSVHLGIPSWKEFALRLLRKLYDNRSTTFMDFKTLENLKFEDTKKILSICQFICDNMLRPDQVADILENIFKVKDITLVRNGLYEKLFRLDAVFLTTNYDDALDLLVEDFNGELLAKSTVASTTTTPNLRQVIYGVENFDEAVLKPHNVIHIHGSIKNHETMVISHKDYIKLYGRTHNDSVRKKYSDFLDKVFNVGKVILFIGYGLEEIEILQYLFEDELKKDTNVAPNRRYLILPCFADDCLKVSYIADYYKRTFSVDLIPCDMSKKGYEVLEDVLDLLYKRKLEGYIEPHEIEEIKDGLRLIEEL